MMKDAIRALETGALAELGLLAFVLAFVLVVAYTVTRPKGEREAAKHLPFDDGERSLSDPTLNGADA
ncbi:MAG: hypothetical protein R3181_09815 [Rubricoccaceae bacterium]|nr:hypothetical protein [Rubricoccaceae bacterium]